MPDEEAVSHGAPEDGRQVLMFTEALKSNRFLMVLRLNTPAVSPSSIMTGSSIPPDVQMAAQFERIIRRVKSSMNYRGSYSTRDILGSLVARWLTSGEWERLKQLPPEERHIGESVRRFILDRLDQLRRRGE